MRRGSSGASITCLGDDVIKRQLGNPRVREQGLWLQRHASPALPHVDRVYEESYVMERLAVPPFHLLDHSRTMYVMIGQLTTHIWSRQPVAPLNHDMLLTKLENLMTRANVDSLWPWLYATHANIKWARLHACLTHGDPTFDNVMIREDTSELVLIDPIPAALSVPDLRCVDVGKLLQSAIGWEEARYDRPTLRFNVQPDHIYHALSQQTEFDHNEWVASVFWCVVHLLRVTPYVDDIVRARVRKLIGGAVNLV